MKITANIRLSRYHGSSEGWTLSIKDNAGSIQLLEIDLRDSDIGELMGGGQVKAEAIYRDSPNIGKEMEINYVFANLNWDDFRHGTSETREYEVLRAMRDQGFRPSDGWIPRVPGTMNRIDVSSKGYKIIVRRWVDS